MSKQKLVERNVFKKFSVMPHLISPAQPFLFIWKSKWNTTGRKLSELLVERGIDIMLLLLLLHRSSFILINRKIIFYGK